MDGGGAVDNSTAPGTTGPGGLRLEWLAPAIAAFAALLVILWSLPRGLDPSDEGYYLTEIAHPSDSSATALLFGWVWHPVHVLTGGSVMGLRLVALACTVGVTWMLARAVLGARREPFSQSTAACVGIVAVGLALVPMSRLPATPSYNTLAWLALALAASGCTLAWTGRRPAAGGALIGLAAFLAFMGKPTTALVLGAVVLALTPWTAIRWHAVVAAVLTPLLLTLLLVVSVPGHVVGLEEIVRRGVDATVGHAQLIRLDAFPAPRLVVVTLFALAVSGIAAAVGARVGTRTSRRRWIPVVLGSTPIVMGVGSLALWWRRGSIGTVDTTTPVAALVALGSLLVVAVVMALRSVASPAASSTAVTARIAALLAALPVASAFGTNNNLWSTTAHGVAFWFLAILVVPGTSRAVTAAAGGVAAYAVLVCAVVMPLAPYRSAPLLDTVVTRVALDGQTLRLPRSQAPLTTEMLAVGEALGLSRETRVLDLTGREPGVIWAWGVRPLAQGWVIGGYPESVDAARIGIAPRACLLSEALVLWSPQTRYSIPAEVLAPWGVRVPDDYREVARFRAAVRPATLTSPPGPERIIQVLQPVDVEPTGCDDKSGADGVTSRP